MPFIFIILSISRESADLAGPSSLNPALFICLLFQLLIFILFVFKAAGSFGVAGYVDLVAGLSCAFNLIHIRHTQIILLRPDHWYDANAGYRADLHLFLLRSETPLTVSIGCLSENMNRLGDLCTSSGHSCAFFLQVLVYTAKFLKAGSVK